MKAYCVLAGGGTKALSLVGALRAAHGRGIEFLGYGGTSAGAILACLSAAGYEPDELPDIFVELDPYQLLPEGGRLLREMGLHGGSLRDLLSSQSLAIVKALRSVKHFWRAWPMVRSLWSDLGLYEVGTLTDRLVELLAQKLPAGEGKEDFTFRDLRDAGCPPLRVVASDLHNQRPAVLGWEEGSLDSSVVEAVAASACFPFVFKPVISNDRILADGGLSSNLPAFLFAEEADSQHVPTLAFDLAVDEEPLPGEYAAGSFLSDLVSTSLSASDVILRDQAKSTVHVPIAIPRWLTTFSLGLDANQQAEVMNAGHVSATSFFDQFEPLQTAQSAGQNLIYQLRAKYAAANLVNPVLLGVSMHIEALTGAEDVRVSVMMPTGRQPPTRVVTYAYGMDGDPDRDLELAIDGGCSGKAFVEGAPAVADLETAGDDLESWKMSEDQQAKVRTDRKAMLAVPLRAWNARASRSGEQALEASVIGTLAIDSSTPLLETGWAQDVETADAEVVTTLLYWSDVLSKVMT